MRYLSRQRKKVPCQYSRRAANLMGRVSERLDQEYLSRQSKLRHRSPWANIAHWFSAERRDEQTDKIYKILK